VTDFVTSITMPYAKSSDMVNDVSAPSGICSL